MASRDETIQMVIRARDEASATLSTIQDSVGRLGQSASGLGSAFAALGGIAIAQQLAGAAAEMGRFSAVSMQVESALTDLANNAGTTADSIVAAMSRAAMGTISQYELMLNANKALQFEVAKTPEEMAKLVELATALGRATGRSDTQALEDLVTGIARESKLILDNLSLMIDVDSVTAKYAATLGKTADQLSSYERKQALLNEAFRQGAPALEANRNAAGSAATQIERLDANMKNLQDSLGRFIALTAGDTVGRFATQIAVLNEAMTGQQTAGTIEAQLADLMAQRDKLMAGDNSGVAGMFAGMFGDAQPAIDSLNGQIAQLQEQLNAIKFPVGNMQQAADLSYQAGDAFTSAANASQAFGNAAQYAAMEASYLGAAAMDGAAGLSQLEAMAWSAASSVEAAAGAMARMNQVAGGLQTIRTQAIGQLENTLLRIAEHGGDAQQLAATYGEVSDKIFNMGLSMENTAEAQFQNKLAVQAAIEPYNQQLDTIVESERAAAKLARTSAGGAQQLSAEFSALQSKVSSVLSGAFNLDVGVDTESILGREDAINEDARRLADIAVKGFDSPWYGYFKEKFPALFQEFFAGADGSEGAKKQAAQLLRDFEDGLRPELINKDMAKERVRRMLIGEANTKAMVDEIAKELATEMGISINKVRAAAGGALGLADTATAGAAGDGVPVDIKPMIDQTLLAPITNLTANPQNVTVTLDTATVDGTAIAGELAAKIALTLTPTITWTDDNVNAAHTAFANYAFQAMPTITWDATMLTNAQTYISSVAFGIHPTIQFDDTNLAGAITSLQSYAFEVNPFVSFANSIETAQTTFSAYAFLAYPSISWDATMLANAQTYIASVAFPIAPTLNFDATQLDTARITLQSYGFVINPYVSFDPTNIEVAQTSFANYTFEAMPTITWDAVMVANAQTYISSIAFPVNPIITFDTVNVESAKTTLQSHAFEVNPFVVFDDTNIETAKTTLQSHAFSVQPVIDFSADIASAQTRLQSYAFSIAPTISTGGEDAGSMAVSPTITWDSANIETAKIMLASYLFTVNPYITFGEANMALATEQFKSAFSPEIVPTISLFSADGRAVDFNTPAQMLAQGFTFAFMTEFDAFNPGQYVVEQLSAKIAENYQALDEGAKGMGQRWGSMFLSAVSDTVPIPLIELLVTLVTPAVKEKMSQEASQRGATYNPLPGG